MTEFDRLSRDTEWIDLPFIERERTPREIIEKGVRSHLAGLSQTWLQAHAVWWNHA